MRGGEILSVKEGDQVSNFTLEDLNGHNVSLIDYKDKPVLLLFMTTWIRDTWKMIPHMKEYYSLYNSSGLVIFNIDIMETRKKAEQFAKENNIPYPTLLDTDGEVSRKFGVFGVPIVVLIDRNGRIASWQSLKGAIQHKETIISIIALPQSSECVEPFCLLYTSAAS
jgi:peroxiredoxin